MRIASTLLVCLALLGSQSVLEGCGRAPAPTGLRIPQGTAAVGWPRVMLGLGADGPSVYAGPETDAPAFGYLGRMTRVRVDGPAERGRVPVTIGGAMVVRGWVPLLQLGTYVQHRGRLEGTPAYVGQNDLVSLLERNADGSWRVAARPRFGIPELDQMAASYTSQVAADWIGEAPLETVSEPLNPGRSVTLPQGIEVSIYEQPNGNVIANIPPLEAAVEATVLRERDGWFGVRIGTGPYLVGYVRGPVVDSTSALEGAMGSDVPQRIRTEPGTLFRVAAGTHVRFYNEDVATVRREGWARELGRRDQMVDVFVAVDDAVAVRGLVPAAALTPATEPTGTATPAAAPPAAAPPAETPPAATPQTTETPAQP